MKMEREEQKMLLETDFKNLVFANNPDLYRAMFSGEVDEGEVDWVKPTTEADVEYMMEQLRMAGAFPDED